MLVLARDLITLRRTHPELQTGRYETVSAPDGVWAWRRGDGVAVALNMSDRVVDLDGTAGRVCISTHRAGDGRAFDDRLTLRGWEGVVAEISP